VQRVLAEAAGGQDMGGQEARLAGDRLPPLIGNQRDMMAAPLKLVRQRESGRQVPAGAPGGKHVVAGNGAGLRAHRSPSLSPRLLSSRPLSSRPRPSIAPRQSNLSRLRYGFLRVMASSSPT